MNLEKLDEILAVDDAVRYAGIIDSNGNVIDHKMKKSLLNNDDEEMYRMDIMLMRHMLEIYDHSFGKIITLQIIREKITQLIYYCDNLIIYVTCETHADKKKISGISDKIEQLNREFVRPEITDALYDKEKEVVSKISINPNVSDFDLARISHALNQSEYARKQIEKVTKLSFYNPQDRSNEIYSEPSLFEKVTSLDSILSKFLIRKIGKMPLSQKHEIVFRIECYILIQKIIHSLYRVAQNPQDEDEIKNLVECADTAMGNARFINDSELEKSAALIVKSFKEIRDVRTKIDEYNTVLEKFENLLNRDRMQKLINYIQR